MRSPNGNPKIRGLFLVRITLQRPKPFWVYPESLRSFLIPLDEGEQTQSQPGDFCSSAEPASTLSKPTEEHSGHSPIRNPLPTTGPVVTRKLRPGTLVPWSWGLLGDMQPGWLQDDRVLNLHSLSLLLQKSVSHDLPLQRIMPKTTVKEV